MLVAVFKFMFNLSSEWLIFMKSICLPSPADLVEMKQFISTIVSHVRVLFHRVLYGNKITDLPRGVFDGLSALELL